MTRLLTLADIDFSYGSRSVLRSVSLSLEEGSCTALVGPNGSGKTTLLRIAAGALAPESGSVSLDGTPLDRMTRKQRSCAIALVPQQLDVPFDFTVEQIVEQGRTPHLGIWRGPATEDRTAVDRALDLTDSSRLRHRIFNELSGGEKQRVKIALGLAQTPRLLLLDEPTQNLDIGRQAELIDLLHHLQQQGMTLLASMHDLHLVKDNFAIVHLLDPARGLLSGNPPDVLSPDNLRRAFNCGPGRHPLLAENPMFEECL